MERDRLLLVIDHMIKVIDSAQEVDRNVPSLTMKSASFYCLSELKGSLEIIRKFTIQDIERGKIYEQNQNTNRR